MRNKRKPLAESKPHDAYFKAVFSFKEVFIFVQSNLREEMLLALFSLTLEYINKVSSIKKEEIMSLAEALPPKYKRRVKTTWEQLQDEFREKGMKEGMKEGMDEAIRNILLKRPNMANEEIADLLNVTVERVRQIRASFSLKNN